MSHSKERHEKICLNCNAELTGRYCHVCEQENIEPKETVWGLVSHFFYDITHFDGKFFSTARYLITKPGFFTQRIHQRPPGQLPASHPDVRVQFGHLFPDLFLDVQAGQDISQWELGKEEESEQPVDSLKQLSAAKEAMLQNG